MTRNLLGLLAAILLAACGQPDPSAVDAAASPATEEASQSLVYTDYTGSTELFLEFRPLVVGESSEFVSHFTRLSDYTPLTEGRLDVVLEQDGQAVARFRVNEPARTGIFVPAVAPRDSGRFQLALEVSSPSLNARHELGEVTVFSTRDDVQVSQAAPEGDISYLKEQQWNAEFATSLVQQRVMRPSVPGFATVEAPADAGAYVRAPTDGYFAGNDLALTGQRVDRGEVLGYLIPRLGEGVDMGSLRVALESARSRLTLAEQDVQRLAPLVEEGAVPRRRLLEVREQREVAAAELEAARARLEQYQSNESQAGVPLLAPVAGEIIEARARPGTHVQAGDAVFRVADDQRRWLEIQVPERFAREITAASGAWLETDTGPIILDNDSGARVVHVTRAIDPRTRTAGVTIEYPSDHGPALIGERLPAHVFADQSCSLLAIPRSAVIDEDGRRTVYVQTSGETFARRPVELGIVDGEYVEVLSGVATGDRVVSRGAYYVRLAASGNTEIGHGHAH